MLPTMHAVTSSNLAAVGDDGHDLYVRFKPKKGAAEGDVYQVKGAAKHATPLREAQSPGAYYHQHIRNAYEAVKL